MKKQGVIGFLYNVTGDSVALIRKNKPEWQKGLLNGIGGQVEPDESPKAAMIREFKEEAGIKIWDWHCFCVVHFPEYELYCYSSTGDLTKVKSMTTEIIELHHLSAIHRLETIPNLKWIVPLGADKQCKAEVVFTFPENQG